MKDLLDKKLQLESIIKIIQEDKVEEIKEDSEFHLIKDDYLPGLKAEWISQFNYKLWENEREIKKLICDKIAPLQSI